MKNRIASFMLVLALILSLMTVAFADELAEAAEPAEVETESVEEVVEPTAVFYLDGEPLHGVVAQRFGGTYYVTIASMMAELDALAVVEEDTVTATLTAEKIKVADVAVEPVEGEIPADGDETADAAPEDGEAELEEAEPAEEPEEAEEDADGEPVDGENAGDGDAVAEPAAEEAVAEVLDTLTLTAVVGEQYLVANGRYLYAPDGVQLVEGAVAVPVRLLAQALNLSVFYDAATGFVHLGTTGQECYLLDGDQFYDAESLYWLSRIIYSESGNQCLAGRIAVGNVVINRMYNPNFPSTIYDVIFQKNQFSPAASGSIYREPAESSVIAAKLVLDGAQVMEEALFFNRVGLKCYASKHRTFVATIGGHSFYA